MHARSRPADRRQAARTAAKLFLERRHDRDRTALAVEHRGLAESLLDRAAGGLTYVLSNSVIQGLPPCMRVTFNSTVFGAIFFR